MTPASGRGAKPPGERRKTDAAGWVTRLLVLSLAVNLVAIALFAIGSIAILDNRATIEDVQEGRRAAVAVTCGATSAVVEAGRATITGGGGVPEELARNLEALGYPPRHVRERQARRAADAYADAIAQRIEEAAGVKGIVGKHGELDCDRLGELSKTR